MVLDHRGPRAHSPGHEVENPVLPGSSPGWSGALSRDAGKPLAHDWRRELTGVRRLSTVLLVPSALVVVGGYVLPGLAVDDSGRGAADRAGYLFAFFTLGFAIPGTILSPAAGRPDRLAVPGRRADLRAGRVCRRRRQWRRLDGAAVRNSEPTVRNAPETHDGHTDQQPTRLVT